MARFEKDFSGEGQEPISLNELLSLFGGTTAEGQSRQAAIACYLAGGEGWREAMKELGGAFAAQVTGLTEDKGD